MAFLDPVAIAKLESLPVKARVIVEGALTGLHRARLRGSSVEFAEHKEYSPGDEIRHIDWKVYGKADRFYIKQFEQESELTCYLVLDASSSMSYGGRGITKQQYASYLLASLAYLLIRQRDRVSLSVFGGSQKNLYIPPRSRPVHLRNVLAAIEAVNEDQSGGSETLSSALDRLAEKSQRRRGIVIIGSDLFDSDHRSLTVLRHLRARGHHTVVFHTLDPDEVDFPFEGLTMFEALEDDARLLVEPSAIRKTYQKRMRAFLEQTRTECLQNGIEYHLVPTSQPFEQTLLNFLRDDAMRSGVGETAWNS